MPIIKPSGVKSRINQDLRNKRQKIIEEERIRLLGDALILFYETLLEKYELIHPRNPEGENEEILLATHEEVEEFAREYASTKPIGY